MSVLHTIVHNPWWTIGRFRFAAPSAACLAATLLLASCSRDDTTTTPETPFEEVDFASFPACGTRTDFFSLPPIAFTDFIGWMPLGNVATPLHTFPTAHQYVYHSSAGGPLHTVPVVSPGDIIIVRASRRTYPGDGHSDYTLQFAVCREVNGYFNHMATVDPAILTRLGVFDQRCFNSTYAPAYTDCTSRVLSVPVATGAPLGTAGGVPGLIAWDFGLRDTRPGPIPYVNPARWNNSGINGSLLYVVAASDYYSEPMRTQIAARLGRGDGSERRTIPPLGGTLNVEVAGTAQGMWFNTARLGETEGPHLAIVPSNIDPTEFAVSGSESLPGYSPAVAFWRPATSGLVNPAPSTIVADGQIRCLNLFTGRSMLLLLVDATTLRAEARPVSVNCTVLPWTFGTAAVDFHR